jgi:hypothetical protein
MPAFGETMAEARVKAAPAARARPSPLPWPVAALTIGSLSVGLWIGIGWLVSILL